MVVNATTAARVSEFLYPGAAEADGGLDTDTQTWLTNDVIPALSKSIEASDLLNRPLEIAAFVETPARVRRGARSLTLRHAPVRTDGAYTFEVRQAIDRDFTTDETIIDPDCYHLQAAAGIVIFDDPLYGGAGTVQLSYSAGLADAFTGGTINLDTEYPQVVLAATIWAAQVYQRRRNVEKHGETSQGKSVSWTGALQHPPEAVRGMLRPLAHRRMIR